MQKIKRIIIFPLIFVLLLSGCAAGGANNAANNSAAENDGAEDAAVQTEPVVYEYTYHLEDEIVVGEPMTPSDGSTATKSYRMFPYFWYTDEAFDATCAGLLADADIVDEVSLFCDQMNATYMTDDMLNEYTTILKDRVAKLKALGFESVGINMLQTIGHGDYATGTVPYLPMQAAVDYTGLQSQAQPCPRSEDFKEYIAHKYTEFAKTGADFIWVDDDFRVPDKTVSYICFCKHCIKEFNNQNGTNYTRESLVEVLYSSDAKGEKTRKAWSQYLLDCYEEIMVIIKDAVYAVDPEIELGLMIVHVPADEYTLSDWTGMIDALGTDKVRPGGGFHSEDYVREFLTKTFGVAHQLTQASEVPDRQYEFEDFPQTYYKSARIHITECTAALMAGCNGIAFASMPPDYGNTDVLAAIREVSPMWDEIVEISDGWKLYGGSALYDNEYGIYATAGRYFDTSAHAFFNCELNPFVAGYMSYTPYEENSVVTVVTEDMVNPLTDAEIKAMLSKGVFLDGGAARILAERGYSDLVGISRASWVSGDYTEYLNDSEFNGEAVGSVRQFDTVGSYSFTLLPGATALSNVKDGAGRGNMIASYIYENSLGGRVAVFGYTPWDGFYTWQRTEQLNIIFEWLSKGQLPVKVMNDNYIASYFKQPEERDQFMMMLINTNTGDTPENLEVRILGEYNCDFTYYDEHGVSHVISASDAVVADGYTTLTLPGLTGWSFCVVHTGK